MSHEPLLSPSCWSLLTSSTLHKIWTITTSGMAVVAFLLSCEANIHAFLHLCSCSDLFYIHMSWSPLVLPIIVITARNVLTDFNAGQELKYTLVVDINRSKDTRRHPPTQLKGKRVVNLFNAVLWFQAGHSSKLSNSATQWFDFKEGTAAAAVK